MRVRRRILDCRVLVPSLMAAGWAAVLSASVARADVLLDQTSLIGTPTLAAPVQYSFTEATGEALTLTLTDEQTPEAFGGLQVAVTLGDTLVGSGTVDPTTHVATVAIPAAAGTYTVHVVGTPNSAQGIGLFGVCVAPATSATSCIANYSYSGNIFTPSPASNTPSSALDTTFTSTTAGTYTVTITDDAFPAALQTFQAGITLGATAVSVLALGTTTVPNLQASTTYTLSGGALADATLKAGLYSIQILDPTGAKVLDRTFPVGNLSSSTAVNNPATQTLNLTLTDEIYPAALAGLGVAVTNGGSTLLAELTASGTVSNFTAPAGVLLVWQYTVAGAEPGVYRLDLAPTAADAPALLSTTQVINPSGTTATSYAFVVTLPQAGTYTLTANDFQFPDALQSISATVAQNGSVLTQSASGGFTAGQGPVVILVNATPPTTGSGIFGVTVHTSGASPQIVSGGEFVQAVGGVVNSQSISVGVSGNFDVTLADLAFPQDFANLAAVVSTGGQVLGKIYGGGTFPFASIAGSTYLLTFVATPSTTATTPGAIPGYGLYLLNVASAPPSVTLTSSASSVSSGGTVTLTWSSQNTTSCSASGGTGWTGSLATSGTLAVVVTATETLKLTCTGDGGSASQSITVMATAAASSGGGGGGGAMGAGWLLALLSLWALSARSKVHRQ